LNERELRNTAVAGGAAAAHAIATRPNVRVVTEHGAPTRTAAPVLPRAATLAPNRPARETLHPSLPATQSVAPGTERKLPAVQRTVPAEQAQHLDSSRFAHPQGSPANQAQPSRNLQEREIKRNVPVNPPPQNKEYHGNSTGNAATNFRNQTTAPERKVQEYHPPVQNQPQYRAPERKVQEYHPPVQNQQEYRAPERKVQEYHPPQNNAQQYQRAVPPAVQRNAPVTRQPPPERKKDDKNDNNDHH
jgi:hypothetical protein